MKNSLTQTFVLIMSLSLMPSWAIGAEVSLNWEAPITNEDGTTLDDLAGYRIYNDPTTGGQWLVKVYYRASPPAARWLAGHKAARSVARILLMPVVALAWLLNHMGPAAGILFLGILAMILTQAIRHWQVWRRHRLMCGRSHGTPLEPSNR